MSHSGRRARGTMAPAPGAIPVLLLALVWAVVVPTTAGAQVLDSPLCRLVGCTVVTNGSDWELYLMLGAAGRPAGLWAAGGNARPLAPVRTGTLEANGRPWEAFVSDPGNTPEQELKTEVFYPVK